MNVNIQQLVSALQKRAQAAPSSSAYLDSLSQRTTPGTFANRGVQAARNEFDAYRRTHPGVGDGSDLAAASRVQAFTNAKNLFGGYVPPEIPASRMDEIEHEQFMNLYQSFRDAGRENRRNFEQFGRPLYRSPDDVRKLPAVRDLGMDDGAVRAYQQMLNSQAKAQPAPVVQSGYKQANSSTPNFVKSGTESVSESMFLPENPTERQKSVAAKLVELFNKHTKNPEIIVPGTLSRSRVGVDEITRKDLESAGFVPSYVAVPERGQDMWKTYRHPLNGLHFHHHGDDWLFHDDTYASMQMLIKKYKIQHPDASRKDVLKYTLRHALPQSFNHIVHEGGPGYVNWLQNTILGRPGFIEGEVKPPSIARRLGGTVGTAAALSAASRLVGGKWNPITTLGTTAGFLGSAALSDKISDLLKNNPKFNTPGWYNTGVRVGVPLLGTTASFLLSNYAQRRFNRAVDNYKFKRALYKYLVQQGKRQRSIPDELKQDPKDLFKQELRASYNLA